MKGGTAAGRCGGGAKVNGDDYLLAKETSDASNTCCSLTLGLQFALRDRPICDAIKGGLQGTSKVTWEEWRSEVCRSTRSMCGWHFRRRRL